MKKTLLILSLLVSSSLMAETALDLTKKEINLGALSQETNAAANELMVLTRTAKSPKKITIKYKINHMEKKCVSYKVKKKEIPEFSQTVCEAGLNGEHKCEEKTYSGLYDAETVCTGKGLVRRTTSHELKLNFRGAVKLSADASEIFHVNIKQNKISSEDTELSGKAVESASLYKVSTYFNTIKFKAK